MWFSGRDESPRGRQGLAKKKKQPDDSGGCTDMHLIFVKTSNTETSTTEVHIASARP